MRAHSNPTPSDPVCGRALPANGEYPAVVNGRDTYYFCSQACLDRFNRERTRFVRPARKRAQGHVDTLPRPGSQDNGWKTAVLQLNPAVRRGI